MPWPSTDPPALLPTGAKDFREAMQLGSEVYHHLKKVIKAKYGDQIPPGVEPVTVSWMPPPVVGFGIKEA